MFQDTSAQWVNVIGGALLVGGEMTANDHLQRMVHRVKQGELMDDVSQLAFCDPNKFLAGELHCHLAAWEEIADSLLPSAQQQEVLSWIKNRVSVFPYFQPYKGKVEGEHLDSMLPPPRIFKNNVSCRQFLPFIRNILLERITTGAISLVGQVGQVQPPHLVLPLTMEPPKSRLCHDARFLNLWMQDKPFVLDCLADLPRHVCRDSYQTVLEDKSGYDHLLMTNDSRIHTLVFNGVVSTLPTTHTRLDGKPPHTYISYHGSGGVQLFSQLGFPLSPVYRRSP